MKPLIIASVFLYIGCSNPKKELSSYKSTVEYVQSSHKASVMSPDSSTIYRVEYYASSPERWLIVYFKSNKGKSYIYQNFPAIKWDEWNKASSKGTWYHQNLKGNETYFFNPSE